MESLTEVFRRYQYQSRLFPKTDLLRSFALNE
nr:MAG TPA: hypothetical protein [Caudoviricetes sp.]